jgi:hypothetical protein
MRSVYGRDRSSGLPSGIFGPAKAIGARDEEAATIYRYTRAFTPSPDQMKVWSAFSDEERQVQYQKMREEFMDGHTVEEALAIYEELNHPTGIAMCLVSLGVERKPSDRALFDRAIKLYTEAGETEAARKAAMMADVFAPLNDAADVDIELSKN